MTKFAESKLQSCVRLARECSRNSWQGTPSTAHQGQYLAVKRECMADARRWRNGNSETDTMRCDMISACLPASRVKKIHISGTDEHGKAFEDTTDSPAYAEARANGIAWCPGLKVLDLTMSVTFKDKSAGVWRLTKF